MIALRAFEKWRSSSRSGGLGFARSLRRSVGRTSASTDGSGTIEPGTSGTELIGDSTIEVMTSMLHSSFVANNERVITSTGHALLEPLNARSIVLSVLLGSHPPQMPVGRILEFTALFDLPDGTVRTALSRMVAAGDLVNVDGTYRLAGRLVERQAQQDAGRHDPPTDWDGSWWTVAVVSDRRTMAERRVFRERRHRCPARRTPS